LKRVNRTDGNSKRVATNRADSGSHGGRGRNEIRLFRRGFAVAKVDFDVDALGVSQSRLRHPSQQKVGRGY
jgi:hypothetical protein